MDSINLIPANEITEVEGRSYASPTLPVTQIEDFIANFRGTQQANTEQIAQATQALGANVPSSLGGLSGAGSYFTSRYQTPQTNTAVQNLRTAAQADALNTALANEKAIWQKRYQDAYRAYQRRADAKTSANPYAAAQGEDPDYQTTTPEGATETSLSGVAGKYSVVDPITGTVTLVDMDTGANTRVAPGENPTKVADTVKSETLGGVVKTLPNGNTILIRDGFELVEDNGNYFLKNQNTGNLTAVGGA